MKHPNDIWPVIYAAWDLPEPVKHVHDGYWDGDTIDLMIDRRFHQSDIFRFRLLGINAPERYTEEGKAATAALRRFIEEGWPITVESSLMGDFRRWLGMLYDKDGRSINQRMIDEGFAVPYLK
jgi:endonuclease YncB( thermonuclease family)